MGIGVAGQTLGKKKIRIRIVDHSDGETPSPKRAFLRSLIPNTAGAAGTIIAATIVDLRYPGLVGLALWILMYLSAILNEDRRGLPDKIAGTVVIEDPKPQPSKPSSSALPETTKQKPTQSWGMVSDYYTKKPPRTTNLTTLTQHNSASSRLIAALPDGRGAASTTAEVSDMLKRLPPCLAKTRRTQHIAYNPRHD